MTRDDGSRKPHTDAPRLLHSLLWLDTRLLSNIRMAHASLILALLHGVQFQMPWFPGAAQEAMVSNVYTVPC